MFVILTYDVGEKRVNKVRKHLKKYLIWVQNSVFEGEITKGKLEKCLMELNRKIDKNEDSIYVYKVNIASQVTKDIIGEVKNMDEMFI